MRIGGQAACGGIAFALRLSTHTHHTHAPLLTATPPPTSIPSLFSWQGEYGFASNREDFFNLLALSPYHSALAAADAPPDSIPQLPSILVCTADHDDRVVPLHSFKVRWGGGAGAAL